MMNENEVAIRPGIQDGYDGFFVDSADGQLKDLLWRGSEESARIDGSAYLKAYWSKIDGKWVAR